jgi:hypothetical protein
VPWVRWGDTSANHPIVLSVLEHEECDDRLVNEVHGFISRCSAQAGAHTTDYVVTRGTAVLMAGPSRVNVMIAVAIFAGYMSEIEVDGRTAYKLIDDDHDFLHLRLKEEIDWEKQRKSDNSNPALIVPVRLRDGDACRWCGKVVDWSAKTGGRAGRTPREAPHAPRCARASVLLPPLDRLAHREQLAQGPRSASPATSPQGRSPRNTGPRHPAAGHHEDARPEPRHGGEFGHHRRATRQPVGARGHTRSDQHHARL